MALALPRLRHAAASPGQYALGGAIALFLALTLVVPVATVVVVAFRDTGSGGFTLVNFVDFFGNELFRRSFTNSIWVAVWTVVVATLIALPLAYLTSRFELRGSALIQTLGILPLIMPPFVGAVAMQLLLGRNGTFNLLLGEYLGFTIPFMEGLNGVIFVEAVHYFPFILINVATSLRNIDRSMEEAAREGQVYHLWWHPENFGVNLEANLAFLEEVLLIYKRLEGRLGMQNLNILEAAQTAAQPQPIPSKDPRTLPNLAVLSLLAAESVLKSGLHEYLF